MLGQVLLRRAPHRPNHKRKSRHRSENPRQPRNTGDPAVPKDVFISYAKDDRTWAELVCAQLEEAGVSCWIAPRDIAPGVTWPAAITDAIDHCRAMIIVFSTHANQSPHMPREIDCSDTRRVPILPGRVENVTPAGDMEYFLGNRQWFDLHERTIERRITG